MRSSSSCPHHDEAVGGTDRSPSSSAHWRMSASAWSGTPPPVAPRPPGTQSQVTPAREKQLGRYAEFVESRATTHRHPLDFGPVLLAHAPEGFVKQRVLILLPNRPLVAGHLSFCCAPLYLPSVGASTGVERERQQNDRTLVSGDWCRSVAPAAACSAAPLAAPYPRPASSSPCGPGGGGDCHASAIAFMAAASSSCAARWCTASGWWWWWWPGSSPLSAAAAGAPRLLAAGKAGKS